MNSLKTLEAKLTELKAKLAAAEKARDEEMSKDWVEYAQDIMQKMFTDFSSLAKYLERCEKQVAERGWVMSPIGRRRVLFRVFTGKAKYVADAGRRAKNAPIQGIASEVGIASGMLVVQSMDRYLRVFKMKGDVMFPRYQRAVHDANVYAHAFATVIPSIHIKQYEATYGVSQWYEETFGFKFVIEPEIALEISASDDASIEWDWDIGKLPGVIKSALQNAVSIGRLPEAELESAFATCMEPWISAEKRAWLQENYPLLGVSDLDRQICAAVKAAGFKPERIK